MKFQVSTIFILSLASLSYGAYIREIRVFTSNCEQCGMTPLGELSIKVCGQGQAPAICCVAVNLGNSQENFVEGRLDVFSGADLSECYNFEVGKITSNDQFSLTLYHALSDGGKFDYAEFLTSSEETFRCDFQDFLDGSDYEHGKNCRKV